MEKRKFAKIDRDNFDEVMTGIKPRLAFRVDDKLGEYVALSENSLKKLKEEELPEKLLAKLETLKDKKYRTKIQLLDAAENDAKIGRDDIEQHQALILSCAESLESGEELPVDLRFKTMEDFNPLSVVTQVKELRELYEAREKLSDLLGKLDGNKTLDKLLQEVLSKTDDQLKSLKAATEEG